VNNDNNDDSNINSSVFKGDWSREGEGDIRGYKEEDNKVKNRKEEEREEEKEDIITAA
jgi:hypothetical protein